MNRVRTMRRRGNGRALETGFAQVGEWHNACLAYLFDKLDATATKEELLAAALAFADAQSLSEPAKQTLHVVLTGGLQKGFDRPALLGDTLPKIFRGIVYLARRDSIAGWSPEAIAALFGKSGPLNAVAPLKPAELAQLATFVAVFQSSLAFWQAFHGEDEEPQTQALIIWTSDHTGIDLAVLSEADARGAATVPNDIGGLSEGDVKVVRAITGAIASFLAQVRGDADVIIPIGPGDGELPR